MVWAEVSHCILQLEQENKKPLCNCYAYINAMERDPLGSVSVTLKQFCALFSYYRQRQLSPCPLHSILLIPVLTIKLHMKWMHQFKLQTSFKILSCIFYILLYYNYTAVSCFLSRNSWKPEIAFSLMGPQATSSFEIQMSFLLSWNSIKSVGQHMMPGLETGDNSC